MTGSTSGGVCGESAGSIGGSWADVLPLCVGSTYPGSPGGNWHRNYTVRAVLFRLRLSWIPASPYQPELCSGRTSAGALLLPCERVDFADLVLRSLWPLLLFSLQAALCAPSLALEVPDVAYGCGGQLSVYGDRLRLAGAHLADPPGQAGDPQILDLFLEAVPARGSEAEFLQRDLRSLGQEVFVPAAAWHNNVTLPAANWLVSGLQRLASEPKSFNLRADTGFFQQDWLPSLRISLQEPYIINRHVVPGWQLVTPPVAEEDRNSQFLAWLDDLEAIATLLLVCLPAAACLWLLLRFFLWSACYRTSWNFLNTIRSFCSLAILTQVLEFSCVFGLGGAWLGRSWALPLWGSALAAPLAAAPGGFMVLQLWRSPPVPARSRCFCRLRRRTWAYGFALQTWWHFLCSGAAFVVAVALLPSVTKDRPGFRLALADCQFQLEQCRANTGASAWRQVPDSSLELHSFCALQCSDVKVPDQDVALSLGYVTCKLAAFCSGWSLLLHLGLLWVACRVLRIAAKLPRHSGQSGAGEVKAQAKEEPEVLTSARFQQKVSEAKADRSFREALDDGYKDPREEPDLNFEPKLSETGRAAQRMALSIAAQLPEPPEPSGPAGKPEPQGPSASQLKELLENPIADQELVDFARAVAAEAIAAEANAAAAASGGGSRSLSSTRSKSR
ncbi:unnamed protein product [Effrenium voratum]|uniref:Uncharacterized protein n=1 Tax=Effrenium voratum TaxID=2562239 RepID=A0AA36MLV1_9DINO|nr:unnamed protein product [Effrenium voratum]